MPRWPYSYRALRVEVSVWKSHRWACRCRNAQWLRSISTKTSSETAPWFIFSGIQPTGIPHLGNFLGAFRPWVRLQKDAKWKDELNFSIVDLHALTVPQDPDRLEEWRLDTYVALLAVGLDPKRSRIFFQSDVSHVRRRLEAAELMPAGARTCRFDVDPQYLSFNWISVTDDAVEGISSLCLLFLELISVQSRMNLPEDASIHDSEARSALKLGLFSYPVLQAADILLYK